MQDERGFALKCKDGVVRIAFDDLEYVEVINKTVFFHLAGGAVYEATAALADFERELLERSAFIKTHRSYIVNLSHVQAAGVSGVVTKSGHSVPVSRQRRNQVQDAYLQFLRQAQADAAPSDAKTELFEKPERPDGPWKILLLDDDPLDRSFWAEVLQGHGCVTYLAKNGGDALKLAQKEHFDCMLLDVMLPGEDGFSICEKLRALTGAPMIFLSCMTEPEKQLEGFASGAADYITKDTPAELFWAKVKTRITLAASGCVFRKFGPLLLDLAERTAVMDGKELRLAPSEFDILWLVSGHAGRIFTPEEIFDNVWGDPSGEGGQTAQRHMSRLRKKLDQAYKSHCFIETVWGEGYRFVPPRG